MSTSKVKADLLRRYVRFIFAEYEADPWGWITKTPPSVAEFAIQYDGSGGSNG